MDGGWGSPHPAFPAPEIQPQRLTVPELQVMERRQSWGRPENLASNPPFQPLPCSPRELCGDLIASLAFQSEVLQFKKGKGWMIKI